MLKQWSGKNYCPIMEGRYPVQGINILHGCTKISKYACGWEIHVKDVGIDIVFLCLVNNPGQVVKKKIVNQNM